MGQTLAQKILAAHCGRDAVRPGEIVEAALDQVMANDVSGPLVLGLFRQAGGEKVFDPGRVVLVADHFTPNKDIASAENARGLHEFAARQGLAHQFGPSRGGVGHALVAESGLALPGELIVGADSRATTYGALGAFATGVGATDLAAALITGKAWFKVPASLKVTLSGEPGPWVSAKDLALELNRRLGPEGAHYQAIEFGGPLAAALSAEARQTLASMVVETGAKAGLFPADAVTENYLAGRARRPWRAVAPDPDAEYAGRLTIDAGELVPLVARPHSPHEVAPARRAGYEPVDVVFIGSCTNGRIEDLRQAARVLDGRQVHPRVRLMVIPATPAVYAQALTEGLLSIFLAAGGAVGPPCCGPCPGGHLGVLAAGEVAVATTNRNFMGRMGHPQSRVYLAGPAVAAASAVAGRVCDPEEV
ncbi:MAG: 3-isopropylmalate dehydratase large subunit [Thermodesulfobacteriota bacterium]